MKVTVAQLGARRHYAVPVFLERAGLLHRLYTDLCANDIRVRLLDRLLPKVLKRGGLRRILDRHVDDVPAEKIHCFPMYALARARGPQGEPDSPGDLYQGYVNANRRFGDLVVRAGLADEDMVYTFNGAALEILQRAKDLGIRTVVDQTMAAVASVETLLDEERSRWPGWEQQGSTSAEFWRPLAEREEAEWQLADQILCGSAYVAESVGDRSGPIDRCCVVPYGFQPLHGQQTVRGKADGPLNVLFVGTVGLRKGVPYLMEAASRLSHGEVRVRAVGPVRIADAASDQLRRCVELVGAVPRSQVDAHYEWADVLVLPTLAEGSANVCYEAMARGLPVITTPNAGSVVRDGIDGYIVPIRSADHLAERIGHLAEDRELMVQMGINARERIAEYTWEAYARRLVDAIVRGAGAPATVLAATDQGSGMMTGDS